MNIFNMYYNNAMYNNHENAGVDSPCHFRGRNTHQWVPTGVVFYLDNFFFLSFILSR